MTNNIKTIIPLQCPRCQESIFAEFASTSPEFLSSFTLADIQTAKEKAIARVKFLNLPSDKRDEILAWIEDENTVFGPSEVDSIIDSLVK